MSVQKDRVGPTVKQKREVLMSMKKITAICQTLKKLDCIEIAGIILPLIGIPLYFNWLFDVGGIFTNIKSRIIIAVIVVSLLSAVAAFVWCCGALYRNGKHYSIEFYSKLRAERDEYTIIAGIGSLSLFVLKELLMKLREPPYMNEETKMFLETIKVEVLDGIILGLIFVGIYLLFVIAVYYRRLSYAMYVEEAKKG